MFKRNLLVTQAGHTASAGDALGLVGAAEIDHFTVTYNHHIQGSGQAEFGNTHTISRPANGTRQRGLPHPAKEPVLWRPPHVRSIFPRTGKLSLIHKEPPFVL